MGKVKLVLPTENDEIEVMKFREEFETNGDIMHGCNYLELYDDFNEWYKVLIESSSAETVKDGKVPISQFLVVSTEDDRLLGMVNIRHYLNDNLLKAGGHIGYSIRKSERQKGYANEMLSLALDECKKLGIDRALVTCDKANIPSSKTILNNGGILESEVEMDGELVQRHWIDLK